jgi:hypothetical protein
MGPLNALRMSLGREAHRQGGAALIGAALLRV